MQGLRLRTLLFFFLAGIVSAAAGQAQSIPGLLPEQLAVVLNDDDDNSVAVGEFYVRARQIPPQNIVHVNIPNRPRRLTAAEFAPLRKQIMAQLRPDIQAVLMVWTAPYAVECNAITAAFTLGFDAAQCERTCGPGTPSAYFDAAAARPFSDLGMRISMLLPADSVAQAKELIGRGMGAGFRVPAASAYYLITGDAARNSRARYFPAPGYIAQKKLSVKTLRSDSLDGARDIMIYQTGLARVDKLGTLGFLPGALADHLTSTGGDLLGESQMSILRWLEAGATASYGTVSEPCNYWQKFPQPTVLLRHYLAGDSAIEAYWKSVAWPAQGVFIGEPLAAPYRR